MTERLIATTEPSELGYQYYSNLGGYYFVEHDADYNPRDLKPIFDRYTGSNSGFETPDGKEIGRWDLGFYGIFEFESGEYFWDELYKIWDVFESAQYGYVASGYAGLWSGRHAGGKFISDMADLKQTIQDYDDVTIKDIDGELVVYMQHHDGTNMLTLRQITKKGNDWKEENEYELDRRELVETVFNNPQMSVPPHIADRV